MTSTPVWDESVDLVIVGSGGGGLVAALTAADAGLKPLIVEKQAVFGGSTAMSGGVIWLPNNPLMRAEGVPDSHEEALAYFESVVGDAGQASSAERREAFLSGGSEMVSFLERQGVKLVRCAGYSDYYDTRPGGKAAGRSLEGGIWDGHQLGDWHDKIMSGQAQHIGLVVQTNELRHLAVFLRSTKSFRVAVKVALRTFSSRLRGKDLFVSGMSLVGQMTKLILDRKIPLWLNSPCQDLVVENGKVTGIRALRDGKMVSIQARAGVMIAAGGFEHNAEMRRKYSGNQPNEGKLSWANPGNTGEMLAAAIDLGASTDLLDEAWWFPAPRQEIAGSVLTVARQYPRTIIVNGAGRRFVNESNSYVEIGKAMYANDGVPSWLIFDDGFRRRYPMISHFHGPKDILKTWPGQIPKAWLDAGWIYKAKTIEELAKLIDVDASVLNATIQRFNRYAKLGSDPDFDRGQSEYNRCLGDPGNKGNPALGPIDKPPFYATEIRPADVGTCGGVLTDEHGQVLNERGETIPGLYAVGNGTATVTARTYPGPGASIANTMVFGYLAARHAAGLSPSTSGQ